MGRGLSHWESEDKGGSSSVWAANLLSDLGNSVWVSVLHSPDALQVPIPLSFNSHNKPVR